MTSGEGGGVRQVVLKRKTDRKKRVKQNAKGKKRMGKGRDG